jgi:pyruvate dehydrogenase E1 component beta subunit
MGEDVGKVGGVFPRDPGALRRPSAATRVMDTPLSEGGIIGAAVGMALYGMRPVPEIQFSDFIFPPSTRSCRRWRSTATARAASTPAKMVIRTPVGGGIRGGHYHSQSPEA